MAEVIGKDPKDLTVEEITWLVKAADLAAHFLREGKPAKTHQILHDIATHFAVTVVAEADGQPVLVEETVERPNILCSQCVSFLPNYPEYMACLNTCTG